MKAILKPISLILAGCIFFSYCKKEYSLENTAVSEGSLKDLAGNCLPLQINGTYREGKILNDTNTIQLQVRVTRMGRYAIQSDTTNGYSFTANGVFSDTGLINVRMAGSGKPLKFGTDKIMVYYNGTNCEIAITVLPDPLTNPATYSLLGSPNDCMLDTLRGIYVRGLALMDSNTIQVSVNVSGPGRFSITTNRVNGYAFDTSGIFSVAGVQNLVLRGKGTPVTTGANTFTVTAGSSTCTFVVSVVEAVPVNSTDYFPMNPNSYWNYDDLLNQPDTFHRSVVNTTPFDGKPYQNLEETYRFGAPANFYCRKSDSLYYEYGSVEKYFAAGAFSPKIYGDILFLKENLVTGSTWESAEFAGPIIGGQKIYLKYVFSCLDANATITLNGKTFINVYKIQMLPRIHAEGNPYGPAGEVRYFYYAKGIGLIYASAIVNSFPNRERQLRSWQVN